MRYLHTTINERQDERTPLAEGSRNKPLALPQQQSRAMAERGRLSKTLGEHRYGEGIGRPGWRWCGDI